MRLEGGSGHISALPDLELQAVMRLQEGMLGIKPRTSRMAMSHFFTP